MPSYIYQHPETGETKDVFQGMNDKHEYSEGGVEWKRVWNTVEAAANTNIDPFSQAAFIDKIGSTKGSYGDVIDRSAEMSERRAAKRDGVDPVKQQFYKDYSAKRNGAKHTREIKEYLANLTVRI